ncbi:hypothetical protein [uncultured Bradyrhizobium sp.]|uniref:hypothetical protein n=1 Tax=uncultured Bradyrhizobium sp. TaxID=199684 RepID=UPI0035CC0501
MANTQPPPAKVQLAEGENLSKDLGVFFDWLVQVRERIADLPPITQPDIEAALQAQHEVFWSLMTAPAGAESNLPLPRETQAGLIRAARDRSSDLFTLAVAMVAIKLTAWQRRGASDVVQMQGLEGLLDALTFDYQRPKRKTLSLLRDLKTNIDERLSYVRNSKPGGYRFLSKPEPYLSRPDKSESPLKFFERVYGAHVRRGLTQADLRRVDPGLYSALHVWCFRHKRTMANLVPSTRPKRSGSR